MKTKIIVLAALFGISGILSAQTGQVKSVKKEVPAHRKVMPVNQKMRGPMVELNLTEEQKEAFKQGNLAFHKQLQPVVNELGELEAHQKTLMTAEKPDWKAIEKNLERIGQVKTEVAKITAKHRLELRAQLTDEQRLKFDMQRGRMIREHRKNMPGLPGRPAERIMN